MTLTNLVSLIQSCISRVRSLTSMLVMGFSSIDGRLAAIQREQSDQKDRQLASDARQVEILDALAEIRTALQPAPAVGLRIHYVLETGEEVIQGMLQLKGKQRASFTITPVDQFGNPTVLDGPASVGSANTEVVMVSDLSSDGLTGFIESTGKATQVPGQPDAPVQINFSGDAKPGSEIVVIGGSDFVSVLPSDAVTVAFQFGAPVDVPTE